MKPNPRRDIVHMVEKEGDLEKIILGEGREDINITVQMKNGHVINAYPAGKMRKNIK